jgi:hypothetical protein
MTLVELRLKETPRVTARAMARCRIIKLKSAREQEFFIVWVEVELGPEAGDEGLGVKIDCINEGFTGIEQGSYRRISVMLGDLLTHPLPETFNGI